MYKNAIGRRKTATARLYIKAGSGSFEINKRPIEKYFKEEKHREYLLEPLNLVNYGEAYNIKVRVHGGGRSGQLDAIRLALSRVLCDIDVKNRAILKPKGLLTRDSRMVERKKYGRPKARKKFQFSKR